MHACIHAYMHPSNIAHSPTYILQEPCEWYVSCTWCNCFVMMFCCCSLDDVALLGTKPLDPPDAEPAPSVEPTTSLPVEASPPSVSVEATHSSLLVEATSPSVSVEATPPSLPVQSTRPGFPTEPTGSRFEPLPMNYVTPLDFVSPPLRSALREGRKLIFRERTQLISAISTLQWNMYKATIELCCPSRQSVAHDKENKHDFVKITSGKWLNLCIVAKYPRSYYTGFAASSILSGSTFSTCWSVCRFETNLWILKNHTTLITNFRI